eukprot:TRINITY_DN2673_c0_g1::TRINITY_DN2673_c0_g1_i2::g.26149::m.26149 TRINITY_DN2673_c0_g1::TRINITY_DN2673_c0_g1_i2::g.26149  ORF type:complete len:181 (-),score=7.70,Ank/PF00023.25/0.87,Ank/PF00023.25/4.8e+02 TRINITY_DN2673_c0_g1_i2:242-745(-)
MAILLLSFLDVEARYAYILHHNGLESALSLASDHDSEDAIEPTTLYHKPFIQSSDHPEYHSSQNHSLLALLLQELSSAQQSITPEDYQQDIIFLAFQGCIKNKRDPSLALQCLRLFPSDFFIPSIPTDFLAHMKSYISVLFFRRRSKDSLTPLPRVLTCHMQILNWL